MQDLNDKVTSDPLTAAEWNQMPSELQNIIEAFSIVLSGGDLNQLGKGLANYIGVGNFYTDSGSADAYSLVVVGNRQAPTVYTNGMVIRFGPVADNLTTTPTVNVTGLGAKTIKALGGGAVGIGDISSSALLQLRFSTSNDAFLIEDYAKDLRFDGLQKVIASLIGVVIQGVVSGITIDGSQTNPFIIANGNKQLQINSAITGEKAIGIIIQDVGTGSVLQPVFKTVRSTVDGSGWQLLQNNIKVLESTALGMDFNGSFVDDIFGFNMDGTGLFAGQVIIRRDNNDATNLRYIGFKNSIETQVGLISCDNTSTLYATTSDHRLKTKLVKITKDQAFDLIKALNPGLFNWKTDDSGVAPRWGFLAHELQDHVPVAVTGVKNEKDEEGNVILQTVDMSVMVPHLTSAIQHLILEKESMQTRMDALEQRLEALEK